MSPTPRRPSGVNLKIGIRVEAGVGSSNARVWTRYRCTTYLNQRGSPQSEQLMNREFWHARWETQDIGFHQPDFEPALNDYWHLLKTPAGARVFVPLSGKSLDMVWLAQQGYQVIGS